MLQNSGRKPLPSFALAAALCAALLPQTSLAAKPFDGEWSVRITAKSGDCSAYTVPIEVSDGRISYSGFFTATATGAIRQNGVLKARFSREEDVVDVSGSVAGGSGSGKWASPTKGCVGTWTARKG